MIAPALDFWCLACALWQWEFDHEFLDRFTCQQDGNYVRVLLQIQQQQLLQQHVNFNPSVQLGGQPQQDRFGSVGGHRRIQSHAPQSGIGGLANFNTGGIGSIGSTPAPTPNAQPGVQRGHGRRHSVNVLKGGSNAPDVNAAMQQSNAAFTFPNNNAGASFAPQVAAQAQQAYGRTSGHFSHPSVQLSSSLSPEYLMAGGGVS